MNSLSLKFLLLQKKSITKYMNPIEINVQSEIGKLESVILHRPGAEIENMIPGNVERALYSDILNLNVSLNEYDQLEGVLSKVSSTFQIKNLLEDILLTENIRIPLVEKICKNEKQLELQDYLNQLSANELARQLIEGVVLVKDNLTKYLSKERYALRPLHNLFFMRDAGFAVRKRVLISKMASQVREREALLIEAIFNNHPKFSTTTLNPMSTSSSFDEVTIEGGDILIAREDVILVGIGARTNSHGADYILDKLKKSLKSRHIIIQELPLSPESFIHLDMVFTFLDKDKCMVYDPIILKPNKYQTVHIEVRDGEVYSIENKENLLVALRDLKIDLEPVFCGGKKDSWIQEREQWHSGANFFAFAPGKVIGYGRNVNTIEEMNNHGFEVLKATDIISGAVHPDDYKRCVVTIEGSELARGGGGARCMTMPIRRSAVDW